MYKKGVFILIFMSFSFFHHAFSDTWQDMTQGLSDKEFQSIMYDEEKRIFYVGSENGLYKRGTNEKKWKQIFISRGEYKGVNNVCVDRKGSIYIAAGNGLYASDDMGKNWKRIFRGIGKENNCRDLSINGRYIYLGTQRGIFLSKDNGRTWEKFQNIIGDKEIKSIAISGKQEEIFLYTICGDELYKIYGNGKALKKIFGSDSSENLEEGKEVKDESAFLLNDITYKNGALYLSTNKGIFISKDEGAGWKRFNDAGLTNRFINEVLVLEDNSGEIFAATKRGVFEYIPCKDKWKEIYMGMDSLDVKRLMIEKNRDYLWALCSNRIYKIALGNSGSFKQGYLSAGRILSSFDMEPTINEVQAMAIEYAEVHPDKIRRWRRGAKFKALLPKVTFGIDRGWSDTYEIYTSSTKTYWVYGPEDRSEGWDLNFSWDLSDLIWNESQTNIDIRSKLMVQLRDDIVDEVTRIYFERRRLQVELITDPPSTKHAKLEKELRLQELTAGLDGLTGSRFSRAIKRK